MPIANLPTANSKEVTAAPTQTSRQEIFTRGNILNISANNSVNTASDSTRFAACSATSTPKNHPLQYSPQAASAAFATSDTINKNPIVTTSPSDSTRVRSNFQ